MAYTVKLPVFEGPFDLLLHLVRIEEMDIYEIPIADITQKYLEYIEQMQALDLDVAGDFLVMASQLLSMKAKTLLPMAEGNEDDSEDSDGSIAAMQQSPREFMRQLVAYRKFKDMARELSDRQARQARVSYRHVSPSGRPASESPDETLDLQILLDAFSRVLRYMDREAAEHRIVQENYTVENKIIHLEELLHAGQPIDVTEEFGRCFHKVEMIVTFLAVLELARLKRVRVIQQGSFGQIIIQPLDPTHADHSAAEAAT
jgi:segregation and condensation protein A